MGVLVRLVVLLSFLIFMGWIVGGLYLASVVKTGVETVGPKITGTAVSLDHASISLVLGRGRLTGLIVGNPSGFHTPHAYHLADTRVTFDPFSVFSGKLIINELVVDRPEITYEINFSGNNLDEIEKNARAFGRSHGMNTSVPSGVERIGSGWKGVQINHVFVKDPRLNVSASLFRGRTLTFELDDVHLRDIGKDAEGVTTVMAASRLLSGVTTSIFQTVSRTGTILNQPIKKAGHGIKNQRDATNTRASDLSGTVAESVRGLWTTVKRFFRNQREAPPASQ